MQFEDKNQKMHSARLIWATPETDEILAYIARVSNEKGQESQTPETVARLLAYMEREGHVSPFAMANICIEVNTTRSIGRQILRHWSIDPQEFSQRYADPTELGDFVFSECRMQDTKNRQNSLENADEETAEFWLNAQKEVAEVVKRNYKEALRRGIAKEVARNVLPEGMTRSRLYLNGTLRTWIFYLRSRLDKSTEKPHREVAISLAKIFKEKAPVTYSAFFADIDLEEVKRNDS